MNKLTLLASAILVCFAPVGAAWAQQSSVVIKPQAKQPLPAYKRQAIGHMNAGRFKEAYELLKANLESNKGDVDTRFMLGQCAARLGNHGEALALYQEILADNPDLPRVRLELARAYLAVGDHAKAKEAFEAVQASNPPPVVGENIQRFLDSIGAQRPWQARIALSFVADSNVNSGPELFGTASGRSDKAWSLTGNLSHTHSLKSNVAWQSELNFFSLDYNDENDYDQSILSATSGPTWKFDNMVVSVPILLEHVDVGHDYYSHSYGIVPQVRYILNKELSVDAGVTVVSRDHRTTSVDRDGDSYAFNLSLRKQLDNSGFLQPGLRIGKDETRKDYFDTTSIGLSLGWFTRLPWDMTLYAQPSITRVIKGGVDIVCIPIFSGCPATERNWQYQLTANLTKPLDKKGTSLSFGLTLTRNDSNVEYADYKKSMVTLMLSKRL
jgi:tetratricopeptide (TPR) repeat protein